MLLKFSMEVVMHMEQLEKLKCFPQCPLGSSAGKKTEIEVESVKM